MPAIEFLRCQHYMRIATPIAGMDRSYTRGVSSFRVVGAMNDGFCGRQEHFQQAVEKALPALARRNEFGIIVKQPLIGRLPQDREEARQRQAGALFEECRRKALIEAQGVHHEFKGAFGGGDRKFILHRLRCGDLRQIFFGLLPAPAASARLSRIR